MAETPDIQELSRRYCELATLANEGVSLTQQAHAAVQLMDPPDRYLVATWDDQEIRAKEVRGRVSDLSDHLKRQHLRHADLFRKPLDVRFSVSRPAVTLGTNEELLEVVRFVDESLGEPRSGLESGYRWFRDQGLLQPAASKYLHTHPPVVPRQARFRGR